MSMRTAGITILCGLPLALSACSGPSGPDPRTQPPMVETALIEHANGAARSFTGTVAARVESELGFRVSGKVIQRLVEAGQAVRRGQALMRIDAADLALQVRAQAEAVTAARARATQAAGDEARYRDLVGEGAISASAYEQLKAAADAARAQLETAEAQAVLARNAAGYATLLADADGVVVATLAEPGQVVGAGQAVVRLAHAGPREALVQLPETLRPRLGALARASLYGQPQADSPARLRQLGDAADPLTRTYEARYVLEGALAAAPLGATVSLLLDGAGGPAAGELQVPVGALLDRGKGSGVWVVSGNPATVRWRPVALRGIGDETARVSGELKAGERVVALGAHLLQDGVRVRVAGAAK